MQDGKNLIIAILLCLVVIVGWSYLSERMGWVHKPDPAAVAQQQAKQQAEQQAAKPQAAQAAPQQAEALPVFTPAPGRDLTVSTPLFDAVFYTGGGSLRSFKLKKYQTGLAPDSPLVNLVDGQTANVAPLGLVINSQPSWSTGKWSVETDEAAVNVAAGQQGVLRFNGEVDNLRVVREMTFSANSYLIREKIRVVNASDQARSVRVSYTVAADGSNAAGGRYDAMNAAVRVQLDAGEYRRRQDEKLREMALSLADKVRQSGRSYSTRPLSSYHRRIVHVCLQEALDVQTRSTGDGPMKRVVIMRKKGERQQ